MSWRTTGGNSFSDATHTRGGRRYEFKVEKMMPLTGVEHLSTVYRVCHVDDVLVGGACDPFSSPPSHS